MKRLALFIALIAITKVCFSQTSVSGNITTNGATCATTNACVSLHFISTPGTAPASGSVNISGTWTGTLSFEQSADNGSSWIATNGNPQPAGTAVTSTTANGLFIFSVAATTDLRVRGSASMTGSALVVINSSIAQVAPPSQGTSPPSSYPAIVASAIPGQAYAGAGTLTFTQGSAIVTSSGGSWDNSTVGSILTYTGLTPNFRAVVLAVSGANIAIGSPYPGVNVSGTSSFTSTGNDPCARINAAILNNPGLTIDATGINGQALACTFPVFNGMQNRIGGKLLLGLIGLDSWRTWYLPPVFETIGQAAGSSTFANNTWIQANSTHFSDQNSVKAASSAGVSFSPAASTFTDTNATFQSAVTSAGCDTGGYGHLVLTTPLTGLLEGQTIFSSGFTTASWNGQWPITGVSGTAVEILFSSACQAPTVGPAVVNLVRNDFLQASYAGAATGTLTSAVSNPCGGFTGAGSCIQVTDTVAEFTAADAGSCTLATTGTPTAVYTIAEFVDTTHVNIAAGSDPVWAGNAFTKKCWIQTSVASVASATVLNTTIRPQSTAIGTVVYSVVPPLVAFANWGTGSISPVFISKLEKVTLNCNNVVGCTTLQNVSAEEISSVEDVSVAGWQAYAFETEEGAYNSGPWSHLLATLSSANMVNPLITCFGDYHISPSAFHGVNGLSCVNSVTQFTPFHAFDISSPSSTWQNTHIERFAHAWDICRQTGMLCRGITILNSQPGIGLYNSVLINPPNNTYGSNVALQIIGMATTNAPSLAVIDDHLVASTCGPGRTVIGNSVSLGQAGFYLIGPITSGTSTFRNRWTDGFAAGIDNCFGAASGGNLHAANAVVPGAITVGSLPGAAAGNAGWMYQVTDSTAVAAEGQTCVGASTNKALAFSNGTVWKCF